jgi:Uma2 family endonuclease
MSSAASKDVPRFTSEQYLAIERKADYKSEFYDGFIEAMSGASRAHNLISLSLASQLREKLKDRPCEVYMGDMRVWVGPANRYTYPDVVAVCGEPAYQDSDLDTLLNPTMIVEVLSPSTERKDRGKKFTGYRGLKSLREYVLIDQEKVLVERYIRQGNEWVLTALDRLEDTLRLASIDCEVPLSEIYAKVIPPPEA